MPVTVNLLIEQIEKMKHDFHLLFVQNKEIIFFRQILYLLLVVEGRYLTILMLKPTLRYVAFLSFNLALSNAQFNLDETIFLGLVFN